MHCQALQPLSQIWPGHAQFAKHAWQSFEIKLLKLRREIGKGGKLAALHWTAFSRARIPSFVWTFKRHYHAGINVVFFTKITSYLHCASLSIAFLTLIVAVLLNSPLNYLSQMCATLALFKLMLRALSLNFRELLLVVTPSVTSKSTGR